MSSSNGAGSPPNPAASTVTGYRHLRQHRTLDPTFTPTAPCSPPTPPTAFQLLGGTNGIADLAGNHLTTVLPPPSPPAWAGSSTLYVSDMTWGTVTNGIWAPRERDRSNGEAGRRRRTVPDPQSRASPIPKGVGAHANLRPSPKRPHRTELHPLPVRHRHRRRSRPTWGRSASKSGTAPSTMLYPIRRHHRRLAPTATIDLRHHRHHQPAPRRHRQRRRQRLRPRRLGRRQTHLRHPDRPTRPRRRSPNVTPASTQPQGSASPRSPVAQLSEPLNALRPCLSSTVQAHHPTRRRQLSPAPVTYDNTARSITFTPTRRAHRQHHLPPPAPRRNKRHRRPRRQPPHHR